MKAKFVTQRRKSRERRLNRIELCERLAMQRALFQTNEQLGRAAECLRLARNIRVLEQQIKYIGRTYEEILNED